MRRSTFPFIVSFLFAASALADLGKVDKYFHHKGKSNLSQSKNIGNEVIYQIVVDRFANGNPNNDCIEDGRYCARNHMDFPWYHYKGGDLRGLIQKSDYLKELGVSRLWLTPIFENSHVEVETWKFNRRVTPTSYHGYWIRDWFRLNPYFTDSGVSDFAIVDELLASIAPMKLYLDTVINHSTPADATRESLDYLGAKEPLPSSVRYPHRGAIFRDGQFLTNFDEDLYKRFRNPKHRPWYNSEDRRIENWDNQWEVENLQLDRLIDFDQSSPQVMDYFLDAHKFWMQRFPGVAGYRIDTIKHVPQHVWKSFSKKLYADLPEMEAFGEFWSGGSLGWQSHPFYKDTRFSMLDFDSRYALVDVFGPANHSFSRITEVWEHDPRLADANYLITFLDSHDFPRVRGQGMTKKRYRQAVATWLLSRGIPCIYYGMEQDLHVPGDPGDPFNRPMMSNFSTRTEDFRLFKALIDLRKTNSAARYGVTHVVHETENILVFERNHGKNHILLAVSKNPVKRPDQFNVFNLNFPNGRYVNVIDGNKTPHQVVNGTLKLSLSDGDIIVLATSEQ
jgi:cyclomaltodextrin glucanotransferase